MQKTKVYLIKSSAFLLALLMIGFGIFSSIMIFAQSVEIILAFGYTKEKSAVILSGIGFLLIWLVTLVGDSANEFLIAGYKKASEVEEN
jgi:hypothetical protein